jgi:tetratricopeptide (TPR) repeat protein
MLKSFQLFERAYDVGGTARTSSSLSHICERLDLLDEAIEWAERGLSLALKAEDTSVAGTSHLALGVLYNRVGRQADAAIAFRTSLELAEVPGSTRSHARRHRVIASSYLDAGQYDEAVEHLNASVALFEGEYDPIGIGEALQYLSAVQLELGHLEAARQFVHRGLKLAWEYGDTQREASILAILAAIKDAEDDPDEAHNLRSRAIALFESEGMTPAADALRNHLIPRAPR